MKAVSLTLPDFSGILRVCGSEDDATDESATDEGGGEGRKGRIKPPRLWLGSITLVTTKILMTVV